MPIINITVSEIIAPPSSGFNRIFFISDWFDNGDDLYYLNTTLPWTSKNYQTQIYENDYEVWVHDKLKFDSDNYRLYVPKDPDLRFNGVIHFVKT